MATVQSGTLEMNRYNIPQIQQCRKQQQVLSLLEPLTEVLCNQEGRHGPAICCPTHMFDAPHCNSFLSNLKINIMTITL